MSGSDFYRYPCGRQLSNISGKVSTRCHRRWAKLDDEGDEGMIFIHLGDESEFEAERAHG